MTNSTTASRRTFANPHVGANLMQVDALCPGLAVNSLRILSDHATPDRTIKAGCDLFGPGERNEAIYHLVDGWGALYNLLEDGRRQILQFALPGSALVFISAPSATMTYGAQALTDATVRVISFTELKRFVQDYPETGLQLAKVVAQDRLLAYDHLSSVGRHSARERVAHLLLELFTRYRMRWPGHRIEEMHLPLTQEHIGDATGLTGVHVNRVLRDLRRDGIVEFHYRRLLILNPDKLIDAAGLGRTWMIHELRAKAHHQNAAQRNGSMNVRAFPRTPVRMSNRDLIATDAK